MSINKTTVVTLAAVFASFITNAQTSTTPIIPSEGLTFTSFYRGVIGMISLLVIAYLFSSNRKKINWKTIAIGLSSQILFAVVIIKVPFIQSIFEFLAKIFISILDFTKAGSSFLFGSFMNVESYGYIFAFQVLPTIVFFSAITSLLYYLGAIQWVVKFLAKIFTKLLNISGAESLSVTGNIFLGQTEAPLLIKSYLDKMNKSEIMLVMVGGMATIAGAVLAAYTGFLGNGNPEDELLFAKHLLAASVMGAPGAIVFAKILFPQTEEIDTKINVSDEKSDDNVLSAIANGTTVGLNLALNIAAMLLVFIAMIAMIDGCFEKIGEWTQLNTWLAANTAYDTLTLRTILGTVFAPLMWLIGVAKEDMMLMGQLLGIKLAANEFISYVQLADLKEATSAIHLTYNKSITMATYMLCGFANFASIGIQIGGIGTLSPKQRKTLSELGLKAVLGATIASLMSATIVGMILG